MIKKVGFLLSLALFGFQYSHAQSTDRPIDTEELKSQVQDFSEKMEQMMLEFETLLGNGVEWSDTLISKGFVPLAENLDDWKAMDLDTLNFNELIDQMQGQVDKIGEQDWQFLNEMMENFSRQLKPSTPKKSPAVAAPKRPATKI